MVDFKKKYEKYKHKYYNLIKLEQSKKMYGGATGEPLTTFFGVTGGLGILAIIVAIIYFLFNKKKKKDEDEDEDMIQLKHTIADKETRELSRSANSNIDIITDTPSNLDITNDSYNTEQLEKEKELLDGQLQDNSRRLQEFEETLAQNKEDAKEVDDILDKEERLKRLLKTASEKEEHQRIMKEREELLNKFKEFKINMAKDQKTTDQETSSPVSSIEEDDDSDDANDKAIKLYNKNALKKAFETLKSQKEDDADERAIEFYNTNTLQKTLETLKSPKEKEDDANERAIELYNKNTLKKIFETLKPQETQETQEDKTIQEEDEPKISENIKNKLKKFANKIRRNLAITKQIQEEKKLKLKLKALQKLKANKENKQLNENEEFVKRLDIKQEEDQQFIEELSEDFDKELSEDIDEFTESDINDELDALRKKEKEEEEEEYRMEQERLKKEEEERLAREQDRLRREKEEKEERLKREKEEERLRKDAEEKIQKIAEKLQKQRREDYFKKFKEEEQKKMQYNPLKQCILDNLQKEFTELIKYEIDIVDSDAEETISPISPLSSLEPLDLLEETSESRIIESQKIEIADDNFKISLDKSIFECLYEKLKEKALPNKCPEFADMEDFINDESVKECDLFNRKNFQIENFGEEENYDFRLKTWIRENIGIIESTIRTFIEKKELDSASREIYIMCLKRLFQTIISMYKTNMSNSSKNKSITNVKTSPEYESSGFGGVVDNLVPGYYDTGAQMVAKGNYDTDTQNVAGKS